MLQWLLLKQRTNHALIILIKCNCQNVPIVLVKLWARNNSAFTLLAGVNSHKAMGIAGKVVCGKTDPTSRLVKCATRKK